MNPRVHRIPLFLATAVLASLAVSASAQDWRGVQGRMEGTVVGPDGKPVVGAVIKMELPGRGGTQLKTDKKGKWAIGGIGAGNWNIDVEAPGFTTKQIIVPLPSEFTRLPPVEIKLEKAVDPGPSAEILDALKEADAAFEAGKFSEARVLYEKALADPKVGSQASAKTALHMRIARALSQEQQYEKELVHLQAVLDLEPTNTAVKTLMAQEAIKGGMLEKGLALLAELEGQVKDPDVYFNVGVLLLNQNKSEDAVKYFTKALAVDPKYVDGYVQRGLAYLGQQKLADSKADFQKVLELVPDDGSVTSYKYEKLQDGMSQQKAQQVLGSPGVESARSGNSLVRTWSNADGSSLTATFVGDKLTVKAQSGLERIAPQRVLAQKALDSLP
jgi:tetratricopeptide (TPR) repeat protein